MSSCIRNEFRRKSCQATDLATDKKDTMKRKERTKNRKPKQRKPRRKRNTQHNKEGKTYKTNKRGQREKKAAQTKTNKNNKEHKRKHREHSTQTINNFTTQNTYTFCETRTIHTEMHKHIEFIMVVAEFVFSLF